MGTPQEAMEKHRSAIEAITEEQIVSPTLSIEDTIGEAAELAVVANEDRDEFARFTRFDLTIIDTLQERVDCFMIAFTLYHEIALDKGEAKERWTEIEPEAIGEKKKLLRRFLLYYEEMGDAQGVAYIKSIAKGRGRRDLTMDFMQLSERARKEQEVLATLAYGEEQIQRVEEIFQILRGLLGSINAPVAEVEARKLFMQQAFTYLNEAVSTIRRYGQLIFADDEDRLDLYKSAEHQSRGRVEVTVTE